MGSGGRRRGAPDTRVGLQWRAPLAVVLSVLTLAACGSTVQNADRLATGVAGGAGDAGLDGDVLDRGSTLTEEQIAAGGGTGGTGSRNGAGTGRTAGAAGGSGGATGGSGRTVMGRGVTAGEIRIGFYVSIELTAAYAAVGATTEPPPEEEVVRQKVVDAVNAEGGIAGRRIVPVFQSHNPTENFNTSAQAACETFTEDNAVAAVVTSSVGGNDTLARCLAKRRTPVIELNLWPYDKTDYDEMAGYLYQPGRIRSDRYASPFVDGLADGGWMDRGNRIGIIRFDSPVFARLTKLIRARLAARGGNVVEEVAVTTPTGVSEFSGMAAQFNSAILRFQGSNVSHVLFVDNAGIAPFFFLKQAESQGFRPRYGLNSIDIPSTVADQAPDGQLNRAITIGWTPPIDLIAMEHHPGGNAAWARCNELFRKSGDTGKIGFYHHNSCDAVWFLEAAFDRAPSLDPAGFRRGVESLATSFESPYGLGPTVFGPDRYDGASVVAIMNHDNSCKCFRYAPGRRPAG